MYSIRNNRLHTLFTDSEVKKFCGEVLPTDPIWNYWDDFISAHALSRKSEKTILNTWATLRLFISQENTLTSLDAWNKP
jgi:hypothetical protein